MRVHSRRTQVFVDGARVVVDRVAEKERALSREVAEPFRSRPQ